MTNIVFPVITDLELTVPVFLASVGCNHIQEHIKRQNGYRHIQWLQCKHGSGELLINNKKYTVVENQGMLLLPNVPHEYYALTEPWEISWISIGGFAAEQVFNNIEIADSPVLTISRPDITLKAMEKVLFLAQSSNAMKSLECSKIVYGIIMDLIAFGHTSKNDLKMDQYTKLKPVFDFVEDNYNKVITLQELSEVSDLTPQYLCSLFKKITGIRIFEYINSVRVKNSKEMILNHKNLSIKEIAGFCGYDNISYFCEVFKKAEKMTPGEFRKLHGV
ncbi:AraC family transcriptional regulator [Anaerobium acetethylicum]|uniref:AraC-type DNA-binding protein n=1 Tax=Anaerobium acetethylicum TaxID=1619234 RepID=A0A1D3TY35_9FIRM|nr:AraC family transcriptional regulator [Anaerobium acetethylicum]SCP99296.1 AraC-type DNA-binding protein [Anaerobium acetethylicum]